MRLAFVLALLAAAAAEAEAAPELDEARALLRDLQYEEAYPLLLDTWRAGESGPAELREIFRLLGEVAVTLGEADAARGHFARLLALDPDAQLEEGTSPKILAAFRAAGASLGGRALAASYEASPGRVLLTVESDPLHMIAGARATIEAPGGSRTVEVERREDSVEILLPSAPRLEVSLAAVDEHGNRLLVFAPGERPLVVTAPEREPAGAAPPEASATAAAPESPETPIYGRWSVWGGFALGFGALGGWFGLQARDAQDELDRLVATSGEREASEALAAERRLRRDTLVANLSFGAAAGCAVVAAILAFKAARDRSAPKGISLSPRATPDSAGAVLSVPF